MPNQPDRLTDPDGGTPNTSLVEQHIARSVLNCEKLPLLEIILERFVIALSSGMRSLTSASVSVEKDVVEYTAFARSIKEVDETSLVGIVDAHPWNGSLAVSLDANFMNFALDAFLGGQSREAAARKRSGYTPCERAVGQAITTIILRELSRSFEQVGHVSFELRHMEGNAQLATIAQSISPSVHARFSIDIGGHSGSLALIIPHATMDPVRSSLTQVFFGESLAGDDNWRAHMRDRVQESSVELKAVYKILKASLGDALDWEVGSTIEFFTTDDHKARVHCESMDLFRGDVGSLSDRALAIRVTEDVSDRAEDGDFRDIALEENNQ